MGVGYNLPPGCWERDPRAPWNQKDEEPTYIVCEWLPPSARSPKGTWCRVDPFEYGVPGNLELDDLLEACQAAAPEVKFEIRRDDA